MWTSAIRFRPQALLLDAGDTVVFLDTDAISEVLAEAQESVSPTALDAAIPRAKQVYQRHVLAGASHEDGWSRLMRTLLCEAGIPASRATALVTPLRAAHDALNLWRRVPKGVPEALGRARAADMRVGVISNSEGKLSQLFEHVGLAEHFELVLDSALEGVRKPDPEIFLRAARRLALQPDRCIYAEDLPDVDVLGARAVGMHGVLVDAFDHHRGRDDVLRVRSVVELVDGLLALPAD